MKSFEDMDTGEQIDYLVGRFCLGIGKGDLRGEVGLWLMYLQRLGYERGLKEGAKRKKK